MAHFTSNTYLIKREILTFSRKISRKLPKPERKFIADMNDGMMASTSCLLTDIADQLHETNALKVSIIQKADPIKGKVHFCYYRLAKGISGILSYAKEGVRLWFRTKRSAYRQLCLKLTD